MAEKIIIAELDINEQAFLKSAENTKKAIDELVVSQKKLTSQGKTNNQQYVKNDAQLKKLRSEYTQQKNVINALQSPYAKLSRTLIIARNNAKDLAVQYGINSKQAKAARLEVSKLDTQLKKIDNSVGQNQRSVGKYSNALKGISASFLGWTAVIYGAIRGLKAAFDTISVFQQSNAELAAILQLTTDQTKDLRDNAEELGATTAKTANEVVKLQIAYARLGFTQSEIIDLTSATINGSIAMNSTLDETATLVGAVVKSMDSLSTTDAPKIIDIMSLSTAKSALNFEKLNTALPIVLGAANALKIPFTEVTATLGKLADAGIETSTAATSFRNILIESSKRGIDYKEGLDEIINSTNKLKTANEIFGKRAAVSALVIANNTKAVKELDEALQDAAGTADEMAKKQLDTLTGGITLMKSAWDGLVLSIENGEGKIAKAIRGTVNAFTDLFNEVSNYNQLTEIVDSKDLNSILGGIGTTRNVAKASAQLQLLNDDFKALKTEGLDDLIFATEYYYEQLDKVQGVDEVRTKLFEYQLDRIEDLYNSKVKQSEIDEKQADLVFEQKEGIIDLLLEIDNELNARELQKKSIDELNNTLNTYNNAENERIKQAEKRREEQKKKAEEDRQQELKNIQDFNNQKNELQNEIDLANATTKEEKDVLKEEQRFEDELAELEQQELTDAQKYELSELMYDAHLLRLLEIKNKYAEEQTEIDAKQAQKDKKLKDKYAKAEIKAEETVGKARVKTQQMVSDLLLGILGDSLAGRIASAISNAITSIARVKAEVAAAKATNLALATAQSAVDPTAVPRAQKRNLVLGIQSKIQQGLIIGSGVLSLAKSFYDGGVVDSGVVIPKHLRNSGGDDVLIQAKRGEVVLNEQQQARAGGKAFFDSIGVPSHNTGGFVGSTTVTNPITTPTKNNESIAELVANTIDSIKIVAIEDEITSAQIQKVEIVEGANI